jgi:hypothetical protein
MHANRLGSAEANEAILGVGHALNWNRPPCTNLTYRWSTQLWSKLLTGAFAWVSIEEHSLNRNPESTSNRKLL